jgi:hypothetical protein
MKRIPLAVASLAVLLALAASAQAARPTACSMLKSSDYAKVLGHALKMSAGQTSSSCNVFVGANAAAGSLWVISTLTPYNAKTVKQMYSLLKGLVKVRSLGPMGAVVVTGATPTAYAQKGKWFVGFEGVRGVTKAQMIALASLAYKRLPSH